MGWLRVYYIIASFSIIFVSSSNLSGLLEHQTGGFLPPVEISVTPCPHSESELTGFPITTQFTSLIYNRIITIRENHEEFKGCPSFQQDHTPQKLSKVDLHIVSGQEYNETSENAYLSPQGILVANHTLYPPQEFCLHSYTHVENTNDEILTLSYCKFKSNCLDGKKSEKEPCIRKCCPPGMTLTMSTEGPGPCQVLGDSENSSSSWKGFFFYDKTSWEPLKEAGPLKIRPHYYISPLDPDEECPPFQEGEEHGDNELINSRDVLARSDIENGTGASDEYYVFDGFGQIKLLTDGKVVTLGGIRRWETLDDNHCIEFIQPVPDEFGVLPFNTSSKGFLEIDQVVRSQSILYAYALFIATIFYLLTSFFHIILWEYQNCNGWTICCLTLSQGLMSLLLGLSHVYGLDPNSEEHRDAWWCILNGVLAHFFNLAAFTWLTIINFHLWWTFRSLTPRNDQKNLGQFFKYCIIGFGFPSIVVIVGLTLTYFYPERGSSVIIPEYGNDICYVKHHAQGVYVYYIIGFQFLIIFTFFALTCYKLIEFQRGTAKVRASSTAGDRRMVRLFLKLSILLGISWIFEFISWMATVDKQHWFWVIPDIYNLSTSILIFFIFVFKRSTFQQLGQKYPSLKPVTSKLEKSWILGKPTTATTSHMEPSHTRGGTGITGTGPLSQNTASTGMENGKIEMRNYKSFEKR